MLPSADVVVIGGGVVGTSITYYLAKRGVRVCLVEKADIASGTSSSCANAIMLQTKSLGPKLNLARESATLFRGLEEELETDIEFENAGGMVVAETEAEVSYVQAKVQSLQSLGIHIEFVSADRARSLQPALTEHICGASYCPEDSIVNPLKLAMGYIRAAERLGAAIRRFTEVIGIERQGDKILAVLTNRGKIPTTTVVNAAGVWSPALARMVGLHLPIVPRKGELFVTEPVPPMLRGLIVSARYLMSKAPSGAGAGTGQMRAGVIASQTRRGNFLIGSTREFSGFDRRSTYRGIRELVCQTARVLPFMSNMHVLRFYAGLRPTTPDGLPILERSPSLPGFIVASGHEGDGIALSPITGKTIADLIVGEIEDE
ncbi:MAG TPA: FAD-binding oxidoreductase, partial [Anaerolineae bacterium]|nr:FAD-binding oxidoreductase [Anaerolineae bacterium]